MSKRLRTKILMRLIDSLSHLFYNITSQTSLGAISMTHYWALQDAKAHLSDLVKKAQKYGPQHISVRGDPAVVVISQKEYKALITPTISLIEFFRKSPLVGLDLELTRDNSSNRDIDL